MINWSAIEHFKASEFSCNCPSLCDAEDVMDGAFISKLDLARSLSDVPFIINSGYRCLAYNRTLPGSKDTSSHTTGLAADIKATGSRQRFTIVSALLDAGFTRIGIGSDFIHVDNDSDKAAEVIWLY